MVDNYYNRLKKTIILNINIKTMLLNKEVSNYIKRKIKWNLYSDKELVQNILELITLENYIRKWKIDVYFQWFTIDFLIGKHHSDYIKLVKEIKWESESIEIHNHYVKKDKYLSNWIDFSHSWELENLQDIWIELWWSK